MNPSQLVDALVLQYEAALEMLRATMQATPAILWDNDKDENRTWRLAYHTLHYTKMYLAASPEAFVIWEEAVEGADSLGGSWEDPGESVAVDRVHTPEELVGFIDLLLADLPDSVAALPLEAASGFEWYPFSRFELHLNSIRHIQHHTGQLIERLRVHGVTGIDWRSGDGAVGW